MIRFFVVPVEIVGAARGPQYLPWRFDADPENSINSNEWSCIDNGLNPTMICAVDAIQSELAILAAKTDVFGDIPENVDTTPTNQELTAYEQFLEVRAIPGQFNPGTPWREILRETIGGFQFQQRYSAITNEAIEDSGIALNTQLRNMPQYVQAALEQVANEFRASNGGVGYNWAADIKQTDTARTIIRWFQTEWGDKPVLFGFTTL